MIRPLLCFATLSLLAQGPAPVKPKADVPTLNAPSSSGLRELIRAELSPADTGTPEGLMAALYAFVSGPKDEKREIEKIRALFHLQARINAVAKHPEFGPFFRPMELEAFLAFALPQWQKGFFEKGTSIKVQKQDGIAQVWSTYEIRLEASGPALYTGVNAAQCAWDGKRWWIMHLEFQSSPTAALLASQPGPTPGQAKPPAETKK